MLPIVVRGRDTRTLEIQYALHRCNRKGATIWFLIGGNNLKKNQDRASQLKYPGQLTIRKQKGQDGP